MTLALYLFVFVVFVFALLKHLLTYWNRNGICNVEPSFPFGNFGPLVRGKKSFGVIVRDLYWETRVTPYVGIYIFFRPAILIRDVRIVKRILTTDHESFYDRGVYMNKVNDPISSNLFNMQGKEWKNWRTKLTPLFSSAQLKNMFETFCVQGEKLNESLQSVADSDNAVDMKEQLMAFSLNTIAAVFFGIDVNVLTEPDHHFTYFHKWQQRPSLLMSLRQLGTFLCPE